MNHQQLLGEQQVEDELFVVMDRADLGVDPRECIQRPHRLDAAHARNVVEQLPGAVALLQQAALGQHQVIDALIATQGGLDRMLARHVGTQAHVGQHVDAFDVALGVVFRAGNGDPAGAEAGHAVGLGQAVEGQAEHVRRQRGGGDVLGFVVEDLVVDLVGEQHKIVLARQFDDVHQDFLRIHRAGRVVRVDQHQCLGIGGDLRLHVVNVGEPAGLLVAQVVHRLAAAERHGGGPQRVVGGRDQHFVAVVQQRLHRHDDQLGHAVAQVDVLDGDAFDFLLLAVLHHRLACAEQALGVAVALCGGQVADHILKDFIRRLEAKRRRVADVQLEDAVAFLFQAFGVLEHRAANVVADIGELVRFAELHDGIPIEKTRYAPPKGLKGQEAGARLNAWHTKPTNIRATRAPEKTVRGEIQPAEVST
ncbi:hypothetical protein D3C81_905620 [compost metagenome]